MASRNVEMNIQGAELLAAGKILGLSIDDTLALKAQIDASNGRSMAPERSTEMLRRRYELRAARAQKGNSGATAEQLAELGINQSTYQTGEDFDTANRASWDNTRILEGDIGDQSSLQNFGGSDKDGRTKNYNVAREEQSRARKRRRSRESAVLPKDRPDLDTYVDNLINNGMDPNKGEQLRYALKKQGVTDPVGENWKTGDFGVPETRGNQGRERVRNEDGYPGYFKWESTGDATYPKAPTPPSAQKLRGELNRDNTGAGRSITVPGAKGQWQSVRKKDGGTQRFRYSDRTQDKGNFASYSSSTQPLTDAANDIRDRIISGDLVGDELVEAQALIRRLDFNAKPELQKQALEERAAALAAADQQLPVNEQIKLANLTRAVQNSEAGLVDLERFDDVGFLNNGLTNVTKANPGRYSEQPVSDSPLNAPVPEARQTTVGYVDDRNTVLGNENVDALDRFFAAKYGAEFDAGAQAANRGARFMAENVIDANDLNSAGGYRDTFPAVGINETLGEVSDAFRRGGVKMTRNIRTADELVKASDTYVRIKAKRGTPVYKLDPTTGQNVALSNPTVVDVLADMKVASPLRKKLARSLFAVTSAGQSGVNADLKKQYFETGAGMQRSEQPVQFNREVILSGAKGMEGTAQVAQASGNIEGRKVKDAIRAIRPIEGINNEVAARIAAEQDYEGRVLNQGERRQFEINVRDERSVANSLDGEGLVLEGPETWSRDVSDPAIGAVARADGKSVGGASTLSGKVYQGMTDGQISTWYANKKRKGADAAIAGAQRVRARAAQTDEDRYISDFVARTRTAKSSGMETFSGNTDRGPAPRISESREAIAAQFPSQPTKSGPAQFPGTATNRPASSDPMISAQFNQAQKLSNENRGALANPGLIAAEGERRQLQGPRERVRALFADKQPIREAQVAPSMAPDPWAQPGPGRATAVGNPGDYSQQLSLPPGRSSRDLTPDLRSALFALPNRSGDAGRNIMSNGVQQTDKSQFYMDVPDGPETSPSFRRKRSAVGGDPMSQYMNSPKYQRGRRIGYGVGGSAAALAGILGLSGDDEEDRQEQY